MPEKNRSEEDLKRVCPSCHEDAIFTYIGVQEWSIQIARKLNLPPRMKLYRCSHCDTCASEIALNNASSTAD